MKKIKNFKINCKKLGIPIFSIKKIERSLKEYSGKIYIVGGNVRDLILNNQSQTHPDLVVDLELEKLIKCLSKSKIKFLKIGAKYGSIVVLLNENKFDITIMRSDIKTDGRWAKVKFTNNLVQDSRRRDFTFNSIYCDTDGNLYDPNNGIVDLFNKKVKFIGNVDQRIKEDHLRILRFVRFSLEISNFIDEDTYTVCVKHIKKLLLLSYERRIEEAKKIITNKNLERNEVCLSLMKFFECTFDSKLNFKNFYKLCVFESSISQISFERRIKFLIRKKKKIPKFFAKNGNNLFKKRLESKIHFKYLEEKELYLQLLKAKKVNIVDQLIFDCVEKIISKKKFKEYYNKILIFEKKKIPLNGDDLLKIGFKPGKELGGVLNKLELFWFEKDFRCTKKECIKFVKKYLP